MKPQALLFDLGGVLLDIDGRKVLSYWAEHAGVAAETLQSRFVQDAAYFAFERGEIDADSYFAAVGEQLSIELPPPVWLAGWNAMLGGLRPDVQALLAELHRQLPLYLFSNTNAAHHLIWAERCAPLLQNFSGCFLSHQLGVRKPAPEAFRAVNERIGLPAGQILIFDDLDENVRGARRSGLQAQRVGDASGLRAALRAAGLC